MNWPLFASTFAVTFLAELPDKTAFAALILGARRSPWPVFLGAAGAFVIQTVVSIFAGSLLGLLPERAVHVFAGLLFLGLAAAMWRRREEKEDDALAGKSSRGFWNDAGTAFLVIFIAEWGDLTQFSTAALAARTREPLTIFAGSLAALWCVTGLAVGLGAKIKDRLSPRALAKVAAVAFAAVGLVLLGRDFLV